MSAIEICNGSALVSRVGRGLALRTNKLTFGRTSMNRAVFLGSVTLAFIAGATATRVLPTQQAQAANELTPMIIHVPELSGDALGMASGTGLRSKAFVIQDGMTLAVQAGPVPKHYHA